MSASPVKIPGQPEIQLTRTEHYRENYANSVQVRMSLWDFQIVFGTVQQPSAESVTLENFQGIYLSPQQAKALSGILSQNVAQYERTFGPIALDAQAVPPVMPPVTPPGGVN